MQKPLNIWRFTDGKRGHENQTLGLVAALRSLTSVEEQVLQGSDLEVRFVDRIRRRFPIGKDYPSPHLLLGAGRLTHRALLTAKRATSARAVVLMGPVAWLRPRFDLCFVPEHDGVTAANLVATQGTLTAIKPGGEHSPGRGLILIGGPSSHHGWESAAIIATVREIVDQAPSIRWKLATSRRTPLVTTEALLALNLPNLEVFPVERTTPGWVPGELAASSAVWVTEDSVSMVYEAITSGAATGTLSVPRKKAESRVVRGLDDLLRKGYVSRFDSSAPRAEPSAKRGEFDEASRCAKILLTRLFPERLEGSL